jgi:uncharacterized protein
MRILVAGGTGLIGRALVESLLGDGHRVGVLTRSPESRGGLPSSVEMIHWDAETLGPWVEELSGSDAVVHLAGESVVGRWTRQKKQRIRDSRVLSTRAVATAIRASPSRPRVLVQASAVGFYGDAGDRPITESSSPGDHFLAEVAREWEAASEEVEALGVRRPVLRTGLVLAREGGALPVMALPFRLFVGGPVGGGGQWMPWIHIDDQVGAIRFLIQSEEATGPFNLAAPHPVTNRELSEAMGRVLRRPSLIPVPAFALELVVGELGRLSLMSQRVVPEKLLQLGYVFRFPSLEPALRELLRKD